MLVYSTVDTDLAITFIAYEKSVVTVVGCSCGRCGAGDLNRTLAVDVSDVSPRRDDVADTVAGAV